MIKLCYYACHVHHLFKRSERSYGGAEVNFYYLSREFAKRSEYQVTMLVCDDDQPEIEEVEGVRLKKIKYYNNKQRTVLYGILKRLSIIREFIINDADIFIMSTALSGNIMFYCLLFAKWMRGKKIIYRIASDRDVNGYYQDKQSIISYQYRFSLKHIDLIIAQHQHQQYLLKKTESLESVIISNGFPIRHQEKVAKKYNLWVGRAVELKRPEIILEIANQIPEQQFVLIIPGKGVTKELVIKKSKSLPNVTIVDHVDFFDIDRYFAEARCFVNTSDFEGFPNTFIQSFMNYTPVCSLNVNPDDIINKYHLGKFCNGDINEAISFLQSLDNKELYQLGRNAIQYIERFHRLKDKVAQYEKAFSQLLI